MTLTLIKLLFSDSKKKIYGVVAYSLEIRVYFTATLSTSFDIMKLRNYTVSYQYCIFFLLLCNQQSLSVRPWYIRWQGWRVCTILWRVKDSANINKICSGSREGEVPRSIPRPWNVLSIKWNNNQKGKIQRDSWNYDKEGFEFFLLANITIFAVNINLDRHVTAK